MSSLHPSRRRSKLVTPANSSFSNCVQGHLFSQPSRGPLDAFKPVVYLDEQGRRHGRVSDHLLQRQIETDREDLRKQSTRNVPPSSNLYGIRNPNIAALVRDIPYEKEEEDEEDDEKVQADQEIKLIEYKKSSKAGNRRISSISGKQSVKFDTTPSVNMARLVDSHLTELDDIDDEDEDETGDEDELESIKRISDPESSDPTKSQKTPFTLSDTPSTPKGTDAGITTNSSLEYNPQSDEMHMPPSVEDIIDDEESPKVKEPESSDQEISSPETRPRPTRPSTSPSEQVDERRKLSDSRPKTASSSGKSRISSSTASDDTSALLRSENDPGSPDDDDDDDDIDEQRVHVRTPVPSDPDSSQVSQLFQPDKTSSTFIGSESHRQRVQGEYNASQVIQLKESFQPIINEAASYGHLDIVRKLIECGQSVHTQNILQRTPLHEACVSGNGQLIDELLRNGALIDQRDSRGMTALHVAAKHGTIKCVRMLCEKGCDVNAQDDLGHTAAHFSAMHNHVDTLKYLFEKKQIDLSIRNHENKLPIHYAAKHGSKQVLTFFFQIQYNVFATDSHGNTIAHEACEYNQLECVKLIGKMNRELLQHKNLVGRTPYHMAAFYGSTQTLHWLLELNLVPIDQTDKDGYTMAHLAASRGHGETFSCLVLHQALIDQYTFDRNESALDLARRSGKFSRIEQARVGGLQCPNCKEKMAKEKYEQSHARNAVEQLIHTQIQRGYHLNVPINRSSTQLSQRRSRSPT